MVAGLLTRPQRNAGHSHLQLVQIVRLSGSARLPPPVPVWNAREKFTAAFIYLFIVGTAVAQWLRCCATNRKVAGSIPAGVNGYFIDIILPIALWPWGRLSL